jgi:2-keto-4-pentenoate hydratase/2-oxohepta-3-ene-1,7-dioic acid hydratase in catechol pathway
MRWKWAARSTRAWSKRSTSPSRPRRWWTSGATVAYPPRTSNYHFEMELVLAIGKAGFRVSEANAHELVYGYAAVWT